MIISQVSYRTNGPLVLYSTTIMNVRCLKLWMLDVHISELYDVTRMKAMNYKSAFAFADNA